MVICKEVVWRCKESTKLDNKKFEWEKLEDTTYLRKHHSLAFQTPFANTPEPLYNTGVGVQANFCVSYIKSKIIIVIVYFKRITHLAQMPVYHMVLKCIGYMGKRVLNSHLGSNPDLCYIPNRILTNHVIKRFRCTNIYKSSFFPHTIREWNSLTDSFFSAVEGA